MQSNLENIQIVEYLFNNSILPKFYHTRCTHIFYEGIHRNDIFIFISKHIDIIKDIILKITKRIAATDNIPEHILELVSRPTLQNEIHIINPVRAAIIASCATLPRSIHKAKHSITLQNKNIKLQKSIQKVYINGISPVD